MMYPANGDEYILSGFDIQLVSDQYIPAAEQELKQKAQKYADKVKKDDGTYPTTLRSDWVHEDLISRTFEFGQRINLVDDTYFENGRILRERPYFSCTWLGNELGYSLGFSNIYHW